MSEDEGGSEEEEYEGGRPIGLYLLVGVIVALVAVSGMFAIGYIPPLAKVGGHPAATTSTSRTQSITFLTVTSTLAGPTTTTTLAGKNTTITNTSISTATTTVASTSTSTSTQTSTQTVTSVLTSTASTTVFSPTTTTSTTVTSTTLTTTSTTIAPPSPVTINVTMSPSGIPATLHPGESFVLSVTIQSELAQTDASLFAYQATPGNTPMVTSFYPALPENQQPVIGTSFYTISGTINQNAPVGNYEVDAEVSATSPQNNTQMSLTKQFLLHIVEPLAFPRANLVNVTGQFTGSCEPAGFQNTSLASWDWQCNVTAAPNANSTVTFTVSNAANVPICIQTSFLPPQSQMNAFVKMSPYPFCPNGEAGILIPASVTNWTFTYAVINGDSAASQTISFTFTRAGP